MEVEFGYLPEPLDVDYNGIEFSTLPQFGDSVAWVSGHPNIRQGWFYPGFNGDPYPARVFRLPPTHHISASVMIDDGYVGFALWVLSFFWGMRLTNLREGFLDTTPIKPFALVDFCAIGDPAVPLMLAEQAWKDSASVQNERKRLGAAIHTLFLSCNPRLLNFERFQLLYTALDTCHAMMKERRQLKSTGLHDGRIAWMCDEADLPLPPWAGPAGNLAVLRNAAVHEGLFGVHPFGFDFEPESSKTNLEDQMQRLVCRLLATLLGVTDRGYLDSGIDHMGSRLLRL